MFTRLFFNAAYHGTINGTHAALSEMGMIDPHGPGTPAEQVRLAIAGQPTMAAIADDDSEPETTTTTRKRSK